MATRTPIRGPWTRAIQSSPPKDPAPSKAFLKDRLLHGWSHGHINHHKLKTTSTWLIHVVRKMGYITSPFCEGAVTGYAFHVLTRVNPSTLSRISTRPPGAQCTLRGVILVNVRTRLIFCTPRSLVPSENVLK